ncbi:MAG: acyl-CoA dehydrogenase family protein 9 [Planctomycetota bacterium]|jgi:acyl-CoA dehydrogenase family protein 9
MNPQSSGFVRSLFLGHIESSAVMPFPHPDEEAQEIATSIAEMIADWAASSVDPEAIDADKTIPQSVIDGMIELGLFGLTIPEEFGGAGCGQLAYTAALEAISHRDASVVTVFAAHLGIGMKGLLLYGSEEQRAQWLPALASGERIAAFALTEACAGSDAGALRSTADEQPDGTWKLNGRKIWITNGGIANFFTVFARTTDPEHPDATLMERPISAFIVAGTPNELPGLSIGAPEIKMGLCGSSTTEVGFEDVSLPANALLGQRGEGFKVALNVLNSGRHGLSACCLGQAKLARMLAVAHAKEREQFGRPIAQFGMIQEMLAAMDADIYAMDASTKMTAGMIDLERGETMLEATCCKMFATERLWEICNNALQITGGTGFMREYPYERILRDARINMIFEGTNQVLRMMMGTQGLRPLIKDLSARSEQAPNLDGVRSEFESEGQTFEQLVTILGTKAAEVAEREGKGARDAQPDLRRLSDMATSLYIMAAVLAQVSSPECGASEEEFDVARLACRRLERAFRTSAAETENPDDRLAIKIATRMTS